MRALIVTTGLTLILLAGFTGLASALDAPNAPALPPAATPAPSPDAVSGSMTWYATNAQGCRGTDPNTLTMKQGSGVGTSDVIINDGKTFTFCADQALAIKKTTFLSTPSTPWKVELVFREPHPLPNGTDQLQVDPLCNSIPGDDHFTVKVGVIHLDGTFEGKGQANNVRACQLYQLPVDLQLDPAQALVSSPLFTTGLFSIDTGSMSLVKGEYIAMQVTKDGSTVPGLHLAANLVATSAPRIHDTHLSPSIVVSPPSDPGYPVPELSTIVLALSGLGMVGLVVRRRN